MSQNEINEDKITQEEEENPLKELFFEWFFTYKFMFTLLICVFLLIFIRGGVGSVYDTAWCINCGMITRYEGYFLGSDKLIFKTNQTFEDTAVSVTLQKLVGECKHKWEVTGRHSQIFFMFSISSSAIGPIVFNPRFRDVEFAKKFSTLMASEPLLLKDVLQTALKKSIRSDYEDGWGIDEWIKLADALRHTYKPKYIPKFKNYWNTYKYCFKSAPEFWQWNP